MIKYKVLTGYLLEIKEVEVEKETNTSIWINGVRFKKRSAYKRFFDTWEEAKIFIMEKSDMKIKLAEKILAKANKDSKVILRMEKSDVIKFDV